MSARPKFPGDYTSVLDEPLKPVQPQGLLGLWTDQVEQEYERQRRAKIPALLKHFGLALNTEADDPVEDAEELLRLVVALATKHVPGFQLPPSPWPPKMPINYEEYARWPSWTFQEFAALTLDVEPRDTFHQSGDDYRFRHQRIYRSFPGLVAITPAGALQWCVQNDVSIHDRLRQAILTDVPQPEVSAPEHAGKKASKRGRPPKERERLVTAIKAALADGRYKSIDSLAREKQEITFQEFSVNSADTWARAISAVRKTLASGNFDNSTT